MDESCETWVPLLQWLPLASEESSVFARQAEFATQKPKVGATLMEMMEPKAMMFIQLSAEADVTQDLSHRDTWWKPNAVVTARNVPAIQVQNKILREAAKLHQLK